MDIKLAKSAGFCFGVDKAVKTVYQLLDAGKQVYTLGPIIHNPQVVAELESKGVRSVESLSNVPAGATVVIRSHGVPRDVYTALENMPIDVCDATCPFVAKIHRIVEKHSREGAVILIAGDEGHPEVVGIRGHCVGISYVFSTPEELERLLNTVIDSQDKPVVVVSQTTFNRIIWEKCVEIAKNIYTNVLIFDTICNATAERQREAVALSHECDIMVIVGGRHSSNTAKLCDVCAPNCQTLFVESADELKREQFENVHTVGLTAGASTPADIIKEVLSSMSEIVNNNEVQETVTPASVTEESVESAEQAMSSDIDFAEEWEAYSPSSFTEERVHGTVVAITNKEVQVEVIGRKQAGYIPLNELSADPNANPEDVVKIGDDLELLIMRTNDQEGTIMLSKKRVDAMKGWNDVVDAHENGTVLDGVVTDVIKGGILAVTNGVRVFIPASQASIARMEDLTPMLKQPVRFKVIEITPSRRRAVGSVRAVLKDERKEKEAAFWAQVEVGQNYTGVVKSLTSYGAFVDLGGVDGMVHISELSWNRIKHPSEVLSIGDTVEVYVRDLDNEKKKISLGYRKADENPWEIFKAKFQEGDAVTAKVVGMTAFGAFAQIIPGVDGLIHISQIANRRIDKPQDELKVGQEVQAQITKIDLDNKRISLSIRALLEEAPADQSAAAATEE